MKETMLCITGGIESTWRYHISHKDKTTASLCGKQTMVRLCLLTTGAISAETFLVLIVKSAKTDMIYC
jgi:hypothetical protein